MAEQHLQDAHILIVEDCDDTRRMIRYLLKTEGVIRVEEATNGSNALDLLKTKKFDVIVADWKMPRMSGIELLTEARKINSHKKTPFLMVTSMSETDSVMEAIEAGVSDYVVKPFTAEILINKITKVLRR